MLNIVKVTFSFVFIFGVVAQFNPSNASEFRRADGNFLTQAQAQARKARLSEISYKLNFDLTGSEKEFSAEVQITFSLKNAGLPLTIDFVDGKVSKVSTATGVINASYNGSFITLPASSLREGENTVTVTYSHPYSQDGTGLHRFKDPEDGKSYLYTYLWPYYANRLFPNFDQPNLKATYELSVLAPKKWVVSSTTREENIEKRGQNRFWEFPETARISTYIFSLHAGEYKVWEDMAGDVPIRLFARKTLAEYVDVEEWFTYTKQGLEFYKNYYDIAYPFGKYDQLLVPDFNIGAMENVGAVTFAENYIQRGTSSIFQRQRRAGTILHEMAHMWFGDLVTKDWWNGLWLNESFATYMSALALAEATEFTDGWHNFFLASKQSAYGADSMVTTHPIEVPVPSTSDFFSVFDSITYGKGASVLKQLSHYVGPENFRLGVSNYLKEYSYKNTELKNFTDSIGNQSNINLDGWSRDWLYQAGFNTIKAEIKCEADKITHLAIHQTAPDRMPVLRDQRLQIGLYGREENVLATQISGKTTIVEDANGLACPNVVYPNHDDWGYVQIILDDKSLEAIRGNIGSFKDPLKRSMFWQTLQDMTFAGNLPLKDFIDLAIDEIGNETNVRVLSQVLQGTNAALNLMDRLQPELEKELKTTSPLYEKLLWNKTNEAKAGSDLQKIWFNFFINGARSEFGISKLQNLYSLKTKIKGLKVGQDIKWAILQKLAGLGVNGIDDLIELEAKKDPSDLGQKNAIAANAALPNSNIKEKWLNAIQTKIDPLPLAKQRFAINSLFPSNQSLFLLESLPKILEALPEIGQTKNNYYQRDYTGGLLGSVCQEASRKIYEDMLDKSRVLSTTTLKFLREANQRDEACFKRRSLLQGH